MGGNVSKINHLLLLHIIQQNNWPMLHKLSYRVFLFVCTLVTEVVLVVEIKYICIFIGPDEH